MAWEVRKELDLQLVKKVDIPTCPLRGKVRVCEACGVPGVEGASERQDPSTECGGHHLGKMCRQKGGSLKGLEWRDRECGIATYNRK